MLNYLSSINFDSMGNLCVSGTPFNNNRLRLISATSGKITTVAGNGSSAYGGDFGPATSAALWVVSGASFDASGNVYFADVDNSRVRLLYTN
jgi:hypothetical protein